MTITSSIENFSAPHGHFPHEPGYVFLFSPVSMWEGQVSVAGRSIHRGAVRPGMLRLSCSPKEEFELAPGQARALVVRIPEARLLRMFADLEAKPSAFDVALTPITSADSRVAKLVQILAGRKQISPASQALVTEGIAQALVGLLLAQHEQVTAPASPDCLTDEEMEVGRRWIDQQEGQPVIVRQWAARLNLPPTVFSRRFFKKNGVTPHAWLLERRVKRARELLASTEASICDVALKLGFANQSHFTETFRRLTGTSPARWRKLQNAAANI